MAIANLDELSATVVDRWLTYRFSYTDLPGAQLCIRKKGKIICNKAYGFANVEKRQPFTTNHICHIASHSKMFTSCALHILQEQGVLSLGDTVIKYLPQLSKHKDKRFHEITLRDLLSHRAGLFRDGVNADFWDIEFPFPGREQLVKEVLSAELVYEPNSVSKYSNFGTGLLGLVIEQATASSYEDFVNGKIIRKLGDVKIYPDYKEDKKIKYADGYSIPLSGGKRSPLKHSPANGLAPATGFCSNTESVSLFLHEYLFGNTLVSSPTQADLKHLKWPIANAKTENYGLGLRHDIIEDVYLLGHSGGYPGFASNTRNWVGTDYVFSFIINANEWSFPIIKNMIEIFKKIRDSFDEKDLKSVEVSPVLMNLGWGAFLFVVSKEKALKFSVDTATPCEDSYVLSSKKNGFKSDQSNGYEFVGEQLTFNRSKSGEINGATYAGNTFLTEDRMQKRIRKAQPSSP